MSELTKEAVELLGYENVRQLLDGSWAGTIDRPNSRIICTGITAETYAYRWSFRDKARAQEELAKLVTMNTVPGREL